MHSWDTVASPFENMEEVFMIVLFEMHLAFFLTQTHTACCPLSSDVVYCFA